jgi:molybdate transport system substrate-binding protein
MTATARTLVVAVIAVCVAAVGALAGAAPASAAEVRVLTAGAMKTMVTELSEHFQRETGHTVVITADTGGGLRKRVESGEKADVLVAPDAVMDALAKSNHVVPDSRHDLARTAVGVGVREGAPKPDVSTVDAFKRAVLEAKSIVYLDPASGATSGIHVANVLKQLGLADAIRDKVVLWQGGYAAEAVASGKADLCLHQISEILPVKGVTLVGPLPAEINKVTVYASSLLGGAPAPDAGRALLMYLARPEFRPKFAAAGLDYR